MKRILLLTLGLSLMTVLGCSPAQRSPDTIRQDTAKATEAARQDAKAVVEGVKEGLKAKGLVNINTAAADQLRSLPGIDSARANRIIANRPYDHPDDLVKKRVVSQAEFDRISAQVAAR